ncbi:50S ribosomal protein L22 family protein [Candidatus Cytomitobacter indipagum]|uniref:50S ribosomal protein L22 n=1 Tax=Candidatus Cytomitobacter indipagum TaxID=2601575 RepID=A0A5C0UGX6_9PROT|nr:uL22 family ribosomal protein [Candidatus Cytomitobacter indipagum]QEK38284.1 50S ribosomal protein L22 family protein [Candidatus Cytomitobacter indipagum]
MNRQMLISRFAIAESNKIYGKSFCFQMIARSMRGEDAYKISGALDYMPGKYARVMKKLVDSAISNAINKGIDGSLVIDEILIGRGKYLKRIEFKGRGRVGSKWRPFSNIKVVLKNV